MEIPACSAPCTGQPLLRELTKGKRVSPSPRGREIGQLTQNLGYGKTGCSRQQSLQVDLGLPLQTLHYRQVISVIQGPVDQTTCPPDNIQQAPKKQSLVSESTSSGD